MTGDLISLHWRDIDLSRALSRASPGGSMHNAVDVAIIGAGPAGLTAAHAISVAAPQLKVAVYERSPVLQQRGAGLGLDFNGQKALKAINPDLFRKVLAVGASFSRFSRFNMVRPDGTLVTASNNTGGDVARHNPDGSLRWPCLMGWYELQSTLLDALPPQVSLILGAEWDRYEEDPAGGPLTVHFTPRCGVAPVRAHLLVAADGTFSRVRQQVTGDGPPDYCNTLCWRARLPATLEMCSIGMSEANDATTMVMDTGRLWLSYPILAASSKEGGPGEVVWTVSAQDERLAAAGIDPTTLLPRLRPSSGKDASSAAAAGDSSAPPPGTTTQAVDTQGFTARSQAQGTASKQRCLAALEGWDQAFLDIVAATPPERVVEHGLFIRAADTMSAAAYGAGRVVVLGDAAHPVRPTGQGLNTAIEDCHQLGVALAGAGSGADIPLDKVAAFRVTRAERMAPIMAHTSAQGAGSYDKARQINGTSADGKDGAASGAGEATLKTAMGGGTAVMTSEQFQAYLYAVDWEPLAPLATVRTQQALTV